MEQVASKATVTVNTALNYYLDPNVEDSREAVRNMTSQVVLSAIASKFPEGMATDDTLFWGPIQRKFFESKGVVEMTREQFDRLYVLVKDAKKYPIQLLLNVPVFVEHLESIKHNLKE